MILFFKISLMAISGDITPSLQSTYITFTSQEKHPSEITGSISHHHMIINYQPHNLCSFIIQQFFIDHSSRTTTFVDPRLPVEVPSNLHSGVMSLAGRGTEAAAVSEEDRSRVSDNRGLYSVNARYYSYGR